MIANASIPANLIPCSGVVVLMILCGLAVEIVLPNEATPTL